MADPPSLAESFASTSLSLLERARQHDPEAWERLVKLYSPLIYHWCRSARLPPQDAADLLQDVFQAVATAIESFRHDQLGHTFRGWLRTIVQHKLCDHFRNRQRIPDAAGGSDAQRQLVDLPEYRSAVDESAIELAERRLLLRRDLQLVRAEFEETTWQAFWRVTVEGQKPAAVAADLGISRNAVYLAKSRVLHRLRSLQGEASL